MNKPWQLVLGALLSLCVGAALGRGAAHGSESEIRSKRSGQQHPRERAKPSAPNQAWSLDFVADQLADGRRFRALTIVDVFTRESLAIEVGQSLKGEDVATGVEPHQLATGLSENAVL